MFVYPVVPGAALPEVFTKFAPTPEEPATISPEEIGKSRDAWIDAWTKAVMR
jgi:thiamine transport system substrate-binding protein